MTYIVRSSPLAATRTDWLEHCIVAYYGKAESSICEISVGFKHGDRQIMEKYKTEKRSRCKNEVSIK